MVRRGSKRSSSIQASGAGGILNVVNDPGGSSTTQRRIRGCLSATQCWRLRDRAAAPCHAAGFDIVVRKDGVGALQELPGGCLECPDVASRGEIVTIEPPGPACLGVKPRSAARRRAPGDSRGQRGRPCARTASLPVCTLPPTPAIGLRGAGPRRDRQARLLGGPESRSVRLVRSPRARRSALSSAPRACE